MTLCPVLRPICCPKVSGFTGLPVSDLSEMPIGIGRTDKFGRTLADLAAIQRETDSNRLAAWRVLLASGIRELQALGLDLSSDLPQPTVAPLDILGRPAIVQACQQGARIRVLVIREPAKRPRLKAPCLGPWLGRASAAGFVHRGELLVPAEIDRQYLHAPLRMRQFLAEHCEVGE